MLHGRDAERLHDAVWRGDAGGKGSGVQAAGDVHAAKRAGDKPSGVELEILRGWVRRNTLERREIRAV